MNDALRAVLRRCGIDPGSLKPMPTSSTVLAAVIRGGKPAIDAWLALRDVHQATGYWPVLRGEVTDAAPDLGFDPTVILSKVPMGSPLDVIARQRKAERENMQQWLRQRGEIMPDFLQELIDSDEDVLPDEGDDDDGEEPWPDEPVEAQFSPMSVFDVLSQRPLRKCGLALVRTSDPSECAAHLGFGGWNECPPPEVQVAVMRDWARRFGAVPAAMTNDVVEMHVARPPQTEADATALAREQYVFCEDIVTQGVQSVRRLAITLWRSPLWYFWWD